MNEKNMFCNLSDLKNDSYVVCHLATVKTNNPIFDRYLYNMLKYIKTSNLKNIDSEYPTISLENIEQMKIPLLPRTVQEKINREIKEIEIVEDKYKNIIKEKQNKIRSIVENNKGKKVDRLNTYMTLEYGVALPSRKRKKGIYPVVGSNGIIGYHNDFLIKGPSIIVGRKGSAGEVSWIKENNTPIDTTFYVKLKGKDKLEYIYHYLNSLKLTEMKEGMGSGGINRNDIYKIKISPSLPDIQEKLLGEIIPLEKEIESCKKYLIDSERLKKEIIEQNII